jgi:hypothetical protein
VFLYVFFRFVQVYTTCVEVRIDLAEGIIVGTLLSIAVERLFISDLSCNHGIIDIVALELYVAPIIILQECLTLTEGVFAFLGK